MSDLFFHAIAFIGAVSIILFFSGLLIEATDAIAKRLHRNGFLVAFLLLGVLTSISEMSVAVNATIAHVPQVSAGNLIGASFVIFLGIIPLLAFFGKGISLNRGFSRRYLLFSLAVIGLPALVVFDGTVSRLEGVIMLLSYVLFLVYTHNSKLNTLVQSKSQNKNVSLVWSLTKVAVSAVLIFLSGRVLVGEAVYFSGAFGVSSSFIGLVIIAIGTNIPELVIAFRAIIERQKLIAFGDFVGSASLNTFIFGVLVLVNGPFRIEQDQFMLTSFFLVLGLTMFYVFSRSKNEITRQEGLLLGFVYLLFVLIQFGALFITA